MGGQSPVPTGLAELANIPDMDTHYDVDLQLPYWIGHHSFHLPNLQCYSDGSFFASVPSCGAAVALPDGRLVMVRPKGKAGIYKA